MSSSDNAVKSSVFDEIKVYILHRDVPYEFGNVVAAFSTREKAEAGLEKALRERSPHSGQLFYGRDELSIDECTLDEYLQA